MGPPGPPRRSRRGWAIGAGVLAGVLVAGLLGFVAWDAMGGRPYGELPSCRELLPSQVIDTVPDADRPRAEGEFLSAEDSDWYPDTDEEGYLGRISCAVTDRDDSRLLGVDVALYDHEVYLDGFEEMRQEMEDTVEDWERGRNDEAVLAWEPSGAGESGMTVLYSFDFDEGERTGSSYFLDVNTRIAIDHPVPESMDDAEAIDFLNGFARQVERRLARTAERV
ncbi:hypothetical protein PWG71_09010 [Nocardiopsis sp. N85]|nr:hypothetical protein [Nocardiopsis sp. N85]